MQFCQIWKLLTSVFQKIYNMTYILFLNKPENMIKNVHVFVKKRYKEPLVKYFTKRLAVIALKDSLFAKALFPIYFGTLYHYNLDDSYNSYSYSYLKYEFLFIALIFQTTITKCLKKAISLVFLESHIRLEY